MTKLIGDLSTIEQLHWPKLAELIKASLLIQAKNDPQPVDRL